MKKTKMTEKGEVVLTDSPEEARTLQKNIPVIGICTPGQDKSWSGISFLAEDWEDVDDEYAELAYCRYYHLPRVLICGNVQCRDPVRRDLGRDLTVFPQVESVLAEENGEAEIDDHSALGQSSDRNDPGYGIRIIVRRLCG